jgi:hypothetical protein
VGQVPPVQPGQSSTSSTSSKKQLKKWAVFEVGKNGSKKFFESKNKATNFLEFSERISKFVS